MNVTDGETIEKTRNDAFTALRERDYSSPGDDALQTILSLFTDDGVNHQNQDPDAGHTRRYAGTDDQHIPPCNPGNGFSEITRD